MYDNRKVNKWCAPAAASFASGTTTYHFNGPKGKAGTLMDYGIRNVTVLFTAVTTGATIAVGTTSDADAFGDEFDVGAIAVASGGNSIRKTYKPTAAGFATYMVNRDLPADTVIMVSVVAPTGGTPAGTGEAFVDVIWDD